MILHDSVYHLHPHLFDFVLDIFFGSPWTSAFASDFFCAGNHRLKTASFEAFVLHRFVHPRSHLIKRQIFGIIVEITKGISIFSFGNGIFGSDERPSCLGHPGEPRNL